MRQSLCAGGESVKTALTWAVAIALLVLVRYQVKLEFGACCMFCSHMFVLCLLFSFFLMIIGKELLLKFLKFGMPALLILTAAIIGGFVDMLDFIAVGRL